MIVKTGLPMQDAALATCAAAVAVRRAVKAVCGKELAIKWVNDLFWQGKKCCGILTEAVTDVESGGLDYMVVGIGIDLVRPEGGWGAGWTTLWAPCMSPGSRCRAVPLPPRWQTSCWPWPGPCRRRPLCRSILHTILCPGMMCF